MGKVISLELSVDNCLNFARNAIKNKDFLLAIANLNEGLSLAQTIEDEQKVYSLYVEVFKLSENYQCARDVFVKSIFAQKHNGFFRINFSSFFMPDNDYKTNDDFMEMTAEEILKMNDIRTLFAERKYDDAFKTLSTMELSGDVATEIVECLKSAVACDEKFHLDNYVDKLLEIFAINRAYSEMIKVMLEGGKLTHDIMAGSVDYFIGEANSISELVDMGGIFFINNEVDAAKAFFEAALKMNNADEDSLYYLTVINLLMKKQDEAQKYWNSFKQAYAVSDLPFNMIYEFLNSKDLTYLVPYGEIPFTYSMNLAQKLKKNRPKEDFDEEYLVELKSFAELGEEKHIEYVLGAIKNIKNLPCVIKTYLDILKNPRVSEGTKKRVLLLLSEGGYEGEIKIVSDTSITIFTLINLHHRVNSWWKIVYNALLRNLPFSDFYIPIKCSTLARIIKSVNERIPNLEERDINFAIMLVMVNYLRSLKINVNVYDVAKSMNIDGSEIAEGMEKYGIKELFVN